MPKIYLKNGMGAGATKTDDEAAAQLLERQGFVRCSKSEYQAQLRTQRVTERRQNERAQAEARRIKRRR